MNLFLNVRVVSEVQFPKKSCYLKSRDTLVALSDTVCSQVKISLVHLLTFIQFQHLMCVRQLLRLYVSRQGCPVNYSLYKQKGGPDTKLFTKSNTAVKTATQSGVTSHVLLPRADMRHHY